MYKFAVDRVSVHSLSGYVLQHMEVNEQYQQQYQQEVVYDTIPAKDLSNEECVPYCTTSMNGNQSYEIYNDMYIQMNNCPELQESMIHKQRYTAEPTNGKYTLNVLNTE